MYVDIVISNIFYLIKHFFFFFSFFPRHYCSAETVHITAQALWTLHNSIIYRHYCSAETVHITAQALWTSHPSSLLQCRDSTHHCTGTVNITSIRHSSSLLQCRDSTSLHRHCEHHIHHSCWEHHSFCVHSRPVSLQPNQKFFHWPSLISAFFCWDPFLNDVDYRL